MALDRKPEVLWINDHASSLKAELEQAGFLVKKVKDASAATEALAAHRYDLVLSDFKVPASGVTVLVELKRHAEVPVCLVLSKYDNALAVEATLLGSPVLVQPVSAAVLKGLVGIRSEPTPPAVSFESATRGTVRPKSVSATEAKNEFGRVLDLALAGGAVVITRHELPKAVLLAMDEFVHLGRARTAPLDALTGEFDRMLASMQGSGFKSKLKAAFAASPAQLGKAAVAAAKRNG